MYACPGSPASASSGRNRPKQDRQCWRQHDVTQIWFALMRRPSRSRCWRRPRSGSMRSWRPPGSMQPGCVRRLSGTPLLRAWPRRSPPPRLYRSRLKRSGKPRKTSAPSLRKPGPVLRPRPNRSRKLEQKPSKSANPQWRRLNRSGPPPHARPRLRCRPCGRKCVRNKNSSRNRSPGARSSWNARWRR